MNMQDYKDPIDMTPEYNIKNSVGPPSEYSIRNSVDTSAYEDGTKHHIIEVTDITASELDTYARFSENQLAHIYEPDLGLFIAESPNVIHRALAAGYEPVSILIEKKQLDKMLSAEYEENPAADFIMATCRDIPVYTAEYDELTKLTGFALTRGLLCAMRRRVLPSAEEVCRDARRIAVLENVMNPTNVGAIFRSAAALGMDAVLLTGGCSDPLYRRSARVSMGTVFQIPWTYIEDLTGDNLEVVPQSKSGEYPDNKLDIDRQGGIERLHAMGFKTASMALRNDTIDINDPRLKEVEKLAVILGTEGEGLKTSTIDASDFTIKIPMFHGVDSLNVAAASAVAFWELGKR